MDNTIIDLQGKCSLAELIGDSFAKYADQPAYTCLGQTFTFGETYNKALAFAKYLQHHTNLEQGDRIAIQLPNIIQFPVAAYGAMLAGLVLVNTNPLYTQREMKHQFSDSGAKAIVILADLLPNLSAIQSDTPIETVIATSATDFLMPDKAYSGEFLSLLDCITAGEKESEFTPSSAGLEDLAVLQYTGGTTGLSKGAVLTHGNLLNNAEQCYQRFKNVSEDGKDIYICPLPLYHIYAFLVNLILASSHGAHNVLIPNPRDLDAFVNALKGVKFTMFCGLNTLFVGLCHHPEFETLDFSALKMTISGGTALTQDAAQLWHGTTGCSISEGYGLSETSPVVSFNEPGNERLGTIGFPLTGTEVQIWDDNNQEVPQGEAGELVVKGPQVMQGYWQKPEATAASIVNDFFKTGDVAIAEADGRFRIVDRKKDMIIVSGFNVYPNEVEEVIVSHPQVMEAAVVGEPDDHSGEKVCGYLVLAPGQEVDEAAIIEHCRNDLTAYKVPKKIVFLDELPKSTVGKILRRELRAS